MNMTHQVWMTLPPGEVPGRGERIAAVAADRGLRPHVAFVLGHAEGMRDIHVRDGSPTLAEAYASFDGGEGPVNLGWLGLTESASAQVCSLRIGTRRGLLLRFMEKEFEDLEMELRRGVLDLIAALREASDAREVVWARDYGLPSIIDILDRESHEIRPGRLNNVLAVAEVSEDLFSLMEIYGDETWVGGLRFAALSWVMP